MGGRLRKCAYLCVLSVCVCVLMYACTDECGMRMYVCVCVLMWNVYVSVRMCVCTCMCARVCRLVHVSVWWSVCVGICRCGDVGMCVCV